MADDNIINALTDKELDALAIYLSAQASRTTITIEEFIQSSIALGIDRERIRATLLDDLENSGRIFGEFRRSIKASSIGTINRTRDAGQFAEHGVDMEYRWSAVLVNSCPDCLERHGRVMMWDEWEAEGLPRSGQTRCKQNCYCVLVPARRTVEIDPIERRRRSLEERQAGRLLRRN